MKKLSIGAFLIVAMGCMPSTAWASGPPGWIGDFILAFIQTIIVALISPFFLEGTWFNKFCTGLGAIIGGLGTLFLLISANRIHTVDSMGGLLLVLGVGFLGAIAGALYSNALVRRRPVTDRLTMTVSFALLILMAIALATGQAGYSTLSL